jgi:hypothetical protein
LVKAFIPCVPSWPDTPRQLYGPCVLGGKETKEVDLTLGPQKGFRSGKQSASFDTPQFFDEPEFTVAGVTEAMNPGGHGSDTILQSSEALERDTVSLKDAPSSSRLAASVAATEESLRKTVEHEPGNFDANRALSTRAGIQKGW